MIKDKEKIMEMLTETNEQIFSKSKELIELKNEQNKLDEDIRIKKMYIANEIVDEVDENGKKKYSNQAKRDEALDSRLQIDEVYLADLLRIDEIKDITSNLEIELSSLRNIIKIWEIYSRL